MPGLAAPPTPERPSPSLTVTPGRPVHCYTAEEYLAFERGSPSKHEYYAGGIYAMVGAIERHVLITGNVFFCLKSQLRGRPCKAYQSDMRLRIGPTGLYTYPDVMALCGEVKLSDGHRDTIENPQVVVEVSSPSTEAYDRGEKLEHYVRLDSLTDILLVAQDARRVEHHARQPDKSWKRNEITGNGTVSLPSIGCVLPLDEVYEQIELPA